MANELTFFTAKNALTPELKDIIFDTSINNRYPTLKDYLTSQKIKYAPTDLQTLVKLADNEIYKAVYYLAHLLYYIMEKSNDWGEAGEQQVKISFCRNLLRKDPSIQLVQEDAFSFLSKVEENIENLELNELSVDMAKNRFRNFQFGLLGNTFSSYKTADINRILRFCGSNKFLQGGFYGEDKEFIFGIGKLTQKAGYDVIYLEQELARTPNNIVAMAAIIGNREIYIRKESLKTIFAQKWIEIFDYENDELSQIKENIYRNISEGIKQKTLSLYTVKTKEDLQTKSEDFIAEMGETILYHELGHGITQHDILPVENAAIGEATKIFGENIYTSMLEFMADFAPPYEGIIGPIQNMIRISKEDPVKATRMYYMYLSDTWFFDTEDEYMYIYSDLMSLILLKYIEPNQSVNFTQLEEDISFSPDRTNKEKLSMFERLLELFIWDMQEIKNIAVSATFNLLDQQLDYNKIRKLMLEQFRKNDGFVHSDSYEFLVPFWTNMLGYISSISDSSDKLKNYLKQQEKKTLMKMLVLSAGKKKAEAYKFDHRKFLVDRMKELNIIKYPL